MFKDGIRKYIVYLLILIGKSRSTSTYEGFDYEGESDLESPTHLKILEVKDNLVHINFDHVSANHLSECYSKYLIKVWNDYGHKTLTYLIPPTVNNTEIPYFPNSKNYISVSVSNCKNVGPPSNVVSFHPPVTDPPSPKDFSVTQLNSTSVMLNWVLNDDTNDILQGYRINVTEVSHHLNNRDNVVSYKISDVNREQFKISSSLTEGARFKFSISTLNCVGESKPVFVEIRMEHHVPSPTFKPTFSLKLQKETDGTLLCHPSPITTDDINDNHQPIEDNSLEVSYEDSGERCCYTTISMIWHPNEEGNPGHYFFAKYRNLQNSNFTITQPEYEKDFTVIPDYNPCETYEFMVISGDGNYITESRTRIIAPSIIVNL